MQINDLLFEFNKIIVAMRIDFNIKEENLALLMLSSLLPSYEQLVITILWE